MSSDAPIDYQLVKTLQAQVADEMTRAKQQRDARGERDLSDADERQMAFSVITAVVQRHLASVVASGGALPADAGFDLQLIMAVDAAIYEAGELQELLDDDRWRTSTSTAATRCGSPTPTSGARSGAVRSPRR